MSLAAFGGDDDHFSQHLTKCGDNDSFVKAWKEKIEPHIGSDGSWCGRLPDDISTPSTPEGRDYLKRKSSTPPSLLPATKSARTQQDKSGACSEFDEKEMDEEIRKHFIGEWHFLLSL